MPLNLTTALNRVPGLLGGEGRHLVTAAAAEEDLLALPQLVHVHELESEILDGGRGTNLVDVSLLYRVGHLLANLCQVNSDLGCSTLCLALPVLMKNWQLGKTVERHRSKSTQPKYSSRCPTLYTAKTNMDQEDVVLPINLASLHTGISLFGTSCSKNMT